MGTAVSGMRVLVVTSCTGRKAVQSTVGLGVDDFDDPRRLAERETQLGSLLRPAGAMYTGQQYLRAMCGVRALRRVLGDRAVDVAILSAGYGVTEETRAISPDDVTFTGMSKAAIRRRGARLGVPAAVSALLPGRDIVFLLLGSDYLSALGPPPPASPEQRLVYLARPGETRVARGSVVVPAGKAEASRYGAGLVALKGRMLELVGAAVLRGGAGVLEEVKADSTPSTLIALLDREAERA